MELDHVVVFCADLAAGARWAEDRLGLRPVAGGAHEGRGTRNVLVGLGSVYLEVLGPDPDQPTAAGGWAGLLPAYREPALATAAFRVDDIDAACARVAAAGLPTPQPVTMARPDPAGGRLEWRLAFVEGHPFGNAVPFLIEWGTATHPLAALPNAGTLVALRLAHPRADALDELFGALGFDEVVVDAGEEPRFTAVVETPAGTVILGD